jgi:hypothetical protein
MLSPFYDIFIAGKYRLRYALAYGTPVNIPKIIKNTSLQYGAQGVTDEDFDKLINQLTSGGNISSVIACRKDPEIIYSLCAHFPTKIGKKHLDKIIKVMVAASYSKHCIEALLNIGHSFTKSQIKYLLSVGYDMTSNLETMEYDEFIAMFDDIHYIADFKHAIVTNYSANPQVLDEKIKTMNNFRVKYGIVFDGTDFINVMMKKVYSFPMDLNTILNVHFVAKSIGVANFDVNQLKYVLKNYSIDYGINLNCLNDPATLSLVDKKRCVFFQICEYYQSNNRSVIDREFILDFRDQINIIIFILHPSLTDYDPLEDLFYLLVEIREKANVSIFLDHLLKHNYLIYDEFMFYLLSLGFGNDHIPIMRQYVEKKDTKIHEDYLPFFYMFTNLDSIDILLDYKILPTPENIYQCVTQKQLKGIQNTDVILDRDVTKYINMVTNINYDNESKSVCQELSDTDFLEIYNSLNKNDKDIIVRIPIKDLLDLGTIIRYNIRLTKEYLLCFILYGQWKSIILLLCLTDKYDYLYNMFDFEMILQFPEMMTRMWFWNNILNSSRKLYVLTVPSNYQKLIEYPCNIFDLKLNLNVDVANLLKSNIINDVNTIQNNILMNKQDIRRSYIDRK